jgi:hypothetical protein
MCPIEYQSLDMERSGRGLFSRTLSEFDGKVWENIRKISVRIVGITVEIRTEYIPNAIQKSCRLSQLGPCQRVMTFMAFPIAHYKAYLWKKKDDKTFVSYHCEQDKRQTNIYLHFVEIRPNQFIWVHGYNKFNKNLVQYSSNAFLKAVNANVLPYCTSNSPPVSSKRAVSYQQFIYYVGVHTDGP